MSLCVYYACTRNMCDEELALLTPSQSEGKNRLREHKVDNITANVGKSRNKTLTKPIGPVMYV